MGLGERFELGGEGDDATTASFVQEPRAFGGSTDLNAPGVGGIGDDLDQLAVLEPGNDAAHGRRFDLLGGGQLTERRGASENEHGERRKTGGAFPGSSVLFADAAEEVDGSGMEAVRDVGGRGAIFLLAFAHKISLAMLTKYL